MAQFDFPSSPSTNQTYTANGVSYKWDGVAWRRITTTNGVIKQVQSTTINTTSNYSVAQSAYVTVTGFNVSITPSSNSSKIFITVNIGSLGSNTNAGRIGASLAVNGSLISAAKGSFASVTARPPYPQYEQPMSFSYLHSPGTTSQQTYSVQINHSHSGSRTMYFNQSDSTDGACASTITAMEIT